MRLTVHSDYALRMLIHLAAAEPKQCTIEEVASAYGISRAHLMKVARRLIQAGLVRGVRGRGGGLRLARPAAEIRAGEVVRATEEDFVLAECFGRGGGACRIAPACALRHVLHEALDAFLAALDRHTLADLAGGGRKQQLQALLALTPEDVKTDGHLPDWDGWHL